MKKDVSVTADIYCRWEGSPPTYRLYVNDELFTERTFVWKGGYLTECFHVSAEPGEYRLRYETISNNTASIAVKNLRVSYGQDTAYIQDNILRITDENA
jgi:hypothetical protein